MAFLKCWSAITVRIWQPGTQEFLDRLAVRAPKLQVQDIHGKNGKVENAVKTCKGLLLKAKEDKRDSLLAILSWRNTPSEGLSTSPVQRLMGRRTHTLLPTAEKLLQLNSNLKTTVRSLVARKRLQCKQYYSTSFPWRWERQSEWSYLGNRNGSYVAAHVFLTDTHMKFR